MWYTELLHLKQLLSFSPESNFMTEPCSQTWRWWFHPECFTLSCKNIGDIGQRSQSIAPSANGRFPTLLSARTQSKPKWNLDQTCQWITQREQWMYNAVLLEPKLCKSANYDRTPSFSISLDVSVLAAVVWPLCQTSKNMSWLTDWSLF